MLISDKERLEEIKEQVKYLQGDFLRDDLGWLIEQAERVDELERKVRVDSELFDKQVQQNKRYREALKEIATRKMSTFLTVRDMNVHFIKTAERALEGDD